MIHFDPKVLIRPLSDVEPGSLVRWGDRGQHVGFCILSAGDPNLRKAFAFYDSETHRFNWQHADVPTVVDYGPDVIVRPDVETFAPELTAQADGTLYTLDGVPHLIVPVGNNTRFLNLSTGELQSRQSWPMMGGYWTWVAGVRGGANGFTELLSIAPKFESAFDDEGPTEPDIV
jgi:hypothetical protein